MNENSLGQFELNNFQNFNDSFLGGFRDRRDLSGRSGDQDGQEGDADFELEGRRVLRRMWNLLCRTGNWTLT